MLFRLSNSIWNTTKLQKAIKFWIEWLLIRTMTVLLVSTHILHANCTDLLPLETVRQLVSFHYTRKMHVQKTFDFISTAGQLGTRESRDQMSVT